MPIQVTCPKCLKRFQVSDKFAGKTGPCPNCKQPLKVPEASEEVVIHAPDDGAPKDRSGQSVLKPIERKETDVTRRGLLITAGCVLAVFGLAAGFRLTGGAEGTPLWAQILAIFVLAPPLVWAGYQFLYDQELEPFLGEELRNRILVCSAIFAGLWLVYAFVPSYVFDLDQANMMDYTTFGITLCVMIGLGALASAGSFDLEFGSGIAHYGLYLIAIILLALVSGVTLVGVDNPASRLDRIEQLEQLNQDQQATTP